MGPEGVGNKDISAIAGKASEGMYVTMLKNTAKDQQTLNWLMLLKRKNKIIQVHSYGLLTPTIQNTSAVLTPPVKNLPTLLKYLRANKVDAVMGPLEWSQQVIRKL